MHLMNFAATLGRRINLGELVTKAPVYSGLHGVEGGLGLMIRRWAVGSTISGQDLKSDFLGPNTNNTTPFGRTAGSTFSGLDLKSNLLGRNTDNTTRFGRTGAGRFEQRGIPGRNLRPMNLIQRYLDEDELLERKEKDIVHIHLIKNNTFVTVTDAKGNRKTGASSGCLDEFKGGARLSRYAAEATAEHVGRSARNLRMKSIIMKVKGFTHFRKKKTVILGWKEGYTYSESKRSDGGGNASKIMYVRDVTQLAHNGCRLPKQRRV